LNAFKQLVQDSGNVRKPYIFIYMHNHHDYGATRFLTYHVPILHDSIDLYFDNK